MTPVRAAGARAEGAAVPGVPDEARRAFAAAIERQRRGDIWGAIDYYRIAIDLHPASPDAYNNIAVLLKRAKRYAAAVACLRRAVLLAPQSAALHSNLGNVLWMMDDHAEAERHFRRSLELDPERPETLHNYGLLKNSLGDYRGAIDCFDRALARQPDSVPVRWDRALALLTSGDLARGFAAYDVRFDYKQTAVKSVPLPLWRGEDPGGKTIFVYAEQGAGDTLQFVRYLPLLAQRGARIVFDCQPELLRLMHSVPGIAELRPASAPPPAADFHLPLMSLPDRLGVTLDTIPAAVPYIALPPDAVRPIVPRPAGTRVAIGIVWAGSPRHENDHRRSMPLENFLRLCDLPGASLYSLQKGARAGDIRALGASALIRDLAPQLDDFTDTAGALMQLDVVISVDTAVVHLAGALGRPCFLLLPFTPDWRWLNHRADTPWYPTVRLFRQAKVGDWDGVMQRVQDVIAGRVA